MEFEPVAPAAGSAPPFGLSPESLAALHGLLGPTEPVNWSTSSGRLPTSALASLTSGSSVLLPGWQWPLAGADDPTPIYDELIKTSPDPRTTPMRTDDQERPEVAADDEHGRGGSV